MPRACIGDDRCLRAGRASEAFARRQVAPRPDGQPGQRNPADADAADRHRVQANLRAHVAQLPALHALEREAQADLVLPADLARRQCAAAVMQAVVELRSEEHTSELQSLMRISYAVFCLKKKKTKQSRK